MSNMSDQTTKQSKKTRLIIGEVGVDTETGIVGKGHSYDNGKTFTVDDTIYGRIYHANDHGKIWEGIQDQVVKVVAPAKSAADSAVNAADAAVASAQVTSYAVSAIASATAEAKQGANEAMSRAKSAWDVATGAKEAVTDFDPLLKSAQSDAGKALTQIADTASALSDAKTQFGSDVAAAKELANTAQTTADSAVAVASDASSNATVAIQTASGASLTATNAQGDATIAKQTASEAKVQASNAESDFAQLSIRANKIEANVATNSGAIASVQQTANGLTTTVADIQANGGGVNLAKGTSSEDQSYGDASQTTGWRTPIIATFDNPQAGQQYTISINAKPNGGSWRIQVWDGTSSTQRAKWLCSESTNATQEQKHVLTFTWPSGRNKYLIVQLVNSNDGGQIVWNSAMLEEGAVAHTWSPAPDDVQNQFTQIKESINGVTTIINDPKTGLNATYQTAAGNATTISNVKSDVYQLQTTANGLTSRVGNLESKTNTQETAIEQNKNAIALKADQTAVDKINGTVSQLQSSLTVQAGQIQAKVSASDVTGMLAGYATQDYTQSLITQKADDWNLNLTKLKNDTQTSLTNLAVGVEGVQAQVYNSDGSSKITQLSNLIQSKVGTDDFNNLKQAVDLQTLDSADINNMKTNGHYFVHNLANNPIGGWVYVDVTGNGSDRIRQDVYQDIGTKHKYRRWFDTYWTGWEEGATYTEINQLQDAINLRVTKGDLISQINLQAGTALIQSSKLVLDAKTTIITGEAFIPSAAIANLTADQVQAGTLSGSKVHAGDNSGNAIDMGALSAGYVGFHAYANNGDNTYIDYNGIHNYGASYDTRIQQGKITTNYLTVNGGGMIDFRDSNGTGMVAQGSTLTFDVGNTPAGYLSYNGMPVAEIPDGSGGNELAIRYGLSAAIIPNDNSGAQATFSGAAQKIGYMTGTNQGKQMLSGLEVHSNNHHWFGAVNSDATWNRIEINNNDGVNLAWHDQTHFWISDGKAKLYKDNNDSQTATELEVHGWAWVNGWVEAAGHSQHSTLSSKTRIEEADPDYMLDLVNNTDLTTFAFKSEVAEGLVVRHIGPIIDDVNDVAQYRTPAEFIAPTKTARDDDNMIGALFGAVQALTKRIKKLEDKLNG